MDDGPVGDDQGDDQDDQEEPVSQRDARRRTRRPSRIQIVGTLAVIALLAVAVWAVRGGPAPAPVNPSEPSHQSPTVAPPSSTTTPTTTTTTVPRRVRTPNQARAGFSSSISDLSENDANLARDLDAVAATGAQWVRFDFEWSWVQGDGPTSWDWAAVDRAVAAIQSRGLSIVAIPTYTPAWARAGGANVDDKRPPRNIADFANFVRVAAQRYAPRGINVWEIWNEPNVHQFWDHPDPAAYTALLRVSAAALRGVAPGATILTGGMAPAENSSSSVAPVTFLQGIYAAGGRDSFDAVAIHPYTFPVDPTTRTSSNTLLQTRVLHDVMAAHGDARKLIWATEAGAPTRGDGSVDEQTQAQFVQEYFAVWNSWPWTGPLLWYTIRDAGSGPFPGFGLLRVDGAPKPAFLAFERVIAAR